jgi:hypothetical protein
VAEEPEPSDESSARRPRPERTILLWVLAVFALNLVSILILAARAGSPAVASRVLDLFLLICTFGALVFLGFRALYTYPFRIIDLMLMVFLLSAGINATINAVTMLSHFGLTPAVFLKLPELSWLRMNEEGWAFADLLAASMVTVSLMLAGAALGLRHCHLLKIDHGAARLVTVACGMLALPAAAGVVAFPVVLVRHFVAGQPNAGHAAWLMLLWFISITITTINAVLFIKTLALHSEVSARETAWKGEDSNRR